MVLMFPRSENQEATFSTSVEILMSRLGESIKAPRGEENEREMGIESGTHDGLFAFRNGRRYENCPLPFFSQEESHFLLYLLVGQASRTLHLQFLRILQKEPIANGCVGLTRNIDAEADTEEVGMLMFDCETEGILMQIGDPPLEFSFSR